MKKVYLENFQIINEDLYQVNKFYLDCFLCNSIVIDPMICKACTTLFCKKCINNYITKNNNSVNTLNLSSIPTLHIHFRINTIILMIINIT